ncbi:ATP-binding cassette domain-containing protein, partial [Klebsiella quasipneumoniae]|uniref:ATP-binding cassette domain-containing protein n=1 Tax=Klebsiella quasipneumoniae TaxID=1463165 RepID=UPI00388F27DF
MLHAERLTCIVDDRPLFAELTLSLAAGELLQVAGDNGAGKTSLLRILCGLARPESGGVSWQGQPLAKVRESFHRQLLWLGHKPGVNAALTRLWLTDAPLWILDEPFTALDATAMETLTRRLEQHARQGGSAIL